MTERFGLHGLTSDTLVALTADQLREIVRRRQTDAEVLSRIPTDDLASFAEMFNSELARRAKQHS